MIDWDRIEKYLAELWPKAAMTRTELGLLRRTIEKRDMRHLSITNFCDCLDAERFISRTHKPNMDALVDRLAEMNASNAVAHKGTEGPRRRLRVDVYRSDMDAGPQVSDAQVLARHCLWLSRLPDVGVHNATVHLMDCALECMSGDEAEWLLIETFGEHANPVLDAWREHQRKSAEWIKNRPRRRAVPALAEIGVDA